MSLGSPLEKFSRETQTIPYETKDMSCQGPQVSHQECQTSFGADLTQELKNRVISEAVTSGTLLPFIRRSIPIVTREIQESLSQDWQAIRRSLHPGNMTASEFESVFQTHTIFGDHLIHLQEELQHRQETDSKDMTLQDKRRRAQSAMSIAGKSIADSLSYLSINREKRMVITCLDWNCSGSLMVIGHGRQVKHNEWCNHESFIFVYSLFRDHGRDSAPSLHLDIDGCVTAVKSHFSISSLFAIGCFSGRVCLADTSLKCLFEPSLQHHEDSVTTLHWILGWYHKT